MKIRNDFVSNSSSSSFIIGDSTWIQNLNINKELMTDVLTEMYGSPNVFEIYDLSDTKDRDLCVKEWSSSMSQWYSEYVKKDKRGVVAYTDEDPRIPFEKMMIQFDNMGMLHYFGIYCKDDIPHLGIYNRETQKHENIPQHLIDTINQAWDKCGIVNVDECLKLPFSKFFIHFGDNDLWCCSALQEMSESERKHLSDTNCEVSNKWTTESYSIDRFYEVLIDTLAKRIDISASDKSRILKTFIGNTIAFNAHEG